MMEYPKLLRGLLDGHVLDANEAREFIGAVMDGAVTPVQAAGVLTALAARGERVSEVVGAAQAMRERSLHVEHDLPVVVDVCGTGGDGADTINISTIVAFVVAACDVPVAKHGNRAASSACGSADVLEMCNVPIDLDPQRAASALKRFKFTFMFAARYHPAMKNIAPVRRELGVRTLFNVLGPLTNPARATHQVVGVARESQLELVGDALQALGSQAGAVIHGSGIDEVAGDRPTMVYAFNQERSQRWMLDPAVYGVNVPLCEIQGGSREECRSAFISILEGEKSGRADVIALNAGLALHVSGKAADIGEGLAMAREVLANGKAYAIFDALRSLPA
ncbi:MAG: anthranilate phosphoribosyltransferase [Candidatus Eremiobacteraeota bacterium]|nr:anthranilate phosphoribosyltransferase [Candidatus Eremiobacteraeota bacterium]